MVLYLLSSVLVICFLYAKQHCTTTSNVGLANSEKTLGFSNQAA